MCGSFAINYKHVKRNFIFAIIALVALILLSNFTLANNNYKYLISLKTNSVYCYATNADSSGKENLEEELDKNIQDTIKDIDLSDLENYFAENSDYFYKVFGVTEYKQFLQALVSGELLTDFNSVFSAITSSIKQNIIVILSPLLLVLVIILISVVFKNIKPRVAEDGLQEAIFFICFSVIVTIVVYLIGGVFVQIKSTIQKMQNQMDGIFPVLLLLMNTSGGAISVKAYRPLVLLLSNIVSNVFLKILLPIVVLVFVLGLVGNISPKTKVKKLTDFFNSTFKWIIGVVFTVYMAFMSVQGITASSADGISIKTAKYAIKNYIPMLGGYISDGFEVARVGSHIIKNAVGFSGILMLVVTILSPILLIGVMQLSFKLVAGLIEPISDSRTTGIFDSVSKGLSMLMVVLIGASCMYFIVMFLLVCSVSGGLI